ADPFAPLEAITLGPTNAVPLAEAPDGSSAFGFDAPPVVTWNGTHYLAAWTDRGGLLRVARVTRDGTLLDAGGRAVAAPIRDAQAPGNEYVDQLRPAFATDGERTLLAWYDFTYRVYVNPGTFYAPRPSYSRAVVLDREGLPVAPPLSLSPSGSTRFAVPVERDGSFVVVYFERLENRYDAYAAVVTREGAAGRSLLLAEHAASEARLLMPRAVRLGGEIFAGWAADDDSMPYLLGRDLRLEPAPRFGSRVLSRLYRIDDRRALMLSGERASEGGTRLRARLFERNPRPADVRPSALPRRRSAK
ncbi:MAG TPA: hypothetical protein VF698_17960, partial [Thermoanaerobaculia bacterium]